MTITQIALWIVQLRATFTHLSGFAISVYIWTRKKCNFCHFTCNRPDASQLCCNGICSRQSLEALWKNTQVLLYYFSQNYLLKTDSLWISITACTLHLKACSSSRLHELKHCVSSPVELWWLCVVTHSAASLTSQKWEIMCLRSHHSAGAKS